jgi:hypothetical protein
LKLPPLYVPPGLSVFHHLHSLHVHVHCTSTCIRLICIKQNVLSSLYVHVAVYSEPSQCRKCSLPTINTYPCTLYGCGQFVHGTTDI